MSTTPSLILSENVGARACVKEKTGYFERSFISRVTE